MSRATSIMQNVSYVIMCDIYIHLYILFISMITSLNEGKAKCKGQCGICGVFGVPTDGLCKALMFTENGKVPRGY